MYWLKMKASFVQEVQLVGEGLAFEMPWFTQALQEGTFEHVYRLIDLAVAVSALHSCC